MRRTLATGSYLDRKVGALMRGRMALDREDGLTQTVPGTSRPLASQAPDLDGIRRAVS
jgi:hypothetical protein